MKKTRLVEITKNVLHEFLNEGIDFDPETLEVSYTQSHENNVDTSVENNPTSDNELISGVTVWSIFKRKRGNANGDGNPLVYALKGEKGWHFKSDDDRAAVERQFDLIADKFARLYPIGLTIVIPSGNELNRHIAEVIMSKSSDAYLIEGAISKITAEEVNDIVLEPGSSFRQFYKNCFHAAYKQLCDYFGEMDRLRGGTFARHFVKDSEMRKVLLHTLKVTGDAMARYSKKINGRDVLVIDDTISRGQTLKEACRIINESYGPNSITALTLLSKLYDA